MTSSAVLPTRREMIARLIAANTVSSASDPSIDQGNRPVVDAVAEWAEALGFTTTIQPVDADRGKVNLIATLGHGPGGLVLGGHGDTVPCDADRWTVDPFHAQAHNGRLYGLGACDMKSFLALTIEAAGHFSHDRLKRPLHLVVTADEETTMAGARTLAVSDALIADAAIIGEPTSLEPVRMHKGIGMDRIRLIGQSGHSSDPTYGNNALEGMHTVITALLAHRENLQASHRHEDFHVSTPTLNLGALHGGDNPNRICGECELSFDLRVLPGMNLDAERAALRELTEHAVCDTGLEVTFETLFAGTPPAETSADSDIVRAAERYTGSTSQAVAFGTEAAFYQRAGMDTVILGPGSIAQAHQPDEYVELDQLAYGCNLLTRLIDRFCS